MISQEVGRSPFKEISLFWVLGQVTGQLMYRSATIWCAGISFVAFCGLIIFSMPLVQLFIFSSDQLTVPSFVDDFLLNPIFSLTSWMIPRAPYVFPDLLIYTILRLLLRDIYFTIIAISLLYQAFIAVAARFILKRAIANENKAALAWYLFMGLSLVILAAAQSGLAGQQFDALMPIQLFIPIAHGTAAVSAVIAFCFYERSEETRSSLLSVIFIILSALAIFSDKLFVVFFAMPYCLGVLLASPNSFGIKRSLVFTSKFGISLIIAFYLDTLFTQQSIDPISFPFGERFDVIVDVFKNAPLASIVLFVVCLPAMYVGIRLLLSLSRCDTSAISERKAQAFIVLMTGSGLSVGLLLWQTANPAYARYMVGMQLGGLLASCLLIVSWNRRLVAPLILIGSVGLTATLVVGYLKPSSILTPFTERKRITEGLNACRERLGLQAGYAQYWQARRISEMTGWHFQLNQFEPGSPVPFFWGSNLSWFYYRLLDGQPLISNFIIDDALPRSDIIRLYGVPSTEADCGGLRVLVYQDADELQRRVQATINNRYALEDLTKDFPPSFVLTGPVLGAYSLSTFSRQIGTLDKNAITAMSPRDEEGFLMFGPYIRLPAGSYQIEIEYSCSTNLASNSFDITAELGSQVLKSVELKANDSRCDGLQQNLVLPFKLDKPTTKIEYRARFGGSGKLSIDKVSLAMPHQVYDGGAN